MLRKIAGTPIPIPVKIEPPKSKMPTKELQIRANRKLAPNVAAAPQEPPSKPAFSIATIETSLKRLYTTKLHTYVPQNCADIIPTKIESPNQHTKNFCLLNLLEFLVLVVPFIFFLLFHL